MLRALLLTGLVASLAANVWLVMKWRISTSPTSVSSNPSAAKPVARETEPKTDATSSSRANPTTEAEFRALAGQLQAGGLPPEIVRIAIGIMIHREFHQRREALLARPGPDEYWKNRSYRSDSVDQAALRALEREGRKMVREVAGGDLELFDEDEKRRQFGGLPNDKVAKLKKIFEDYSDLEEQLFSEIPDRGSTEARARSALLAKEKRTDIERLLTPEELLKYDLRNSPAAHRLRGRLGQFQATEGEFLALYPAHKAVTDAEVASGPPGPEMRRAREASERQLDAEMRRVLGEARYAEMKEANDHALQQTRTFATSLNLPPPAANELIAVQKDFSPRLSAVERDRDLTPNQRDAQLYALGSEARERLIRLLGPSGFETYKRRGGGWLGAALNRAPPTPPPSP